MPSMTRALDGRLSSRLGCVRLFDRHEQRQIAARDGLHLPDTSNVPSRNSSRRGNGGLFCRLNRSKELKASMNEPEKILTRSSTYHDDAGGFVCPRQRGEGRREGAMMGTRGSDRSSVVSQGSACIPAAGGLNATAAIQQSGLQLPSQRGALAVGPGSKATREARAVLCAVSRYLCMAEVR